jgi:acyl-CoA dehydrogenase
MIEFSLSPETENTRSIVHMMAESTMRPISREYDEREHEKPMDWINMMWTATKGMGSVGNEKKEWQGERRPSERQVRMAVVIEELSWGDAGLYLSIPNAGLGGAAVMAAGTPEQKERFRCVSRWRSQVGRDGDLNQAAVLTPRQLHDWCAMATTGSLTVQIFCTSGQMAVDKSEGFVVVWATVDKSAGRAGIKAFIVDHHTPGMTVAKVEDKMGIRASDTAMLVFEDCRIPLENILGSPEVKQSTEGFKGVMATFDATRPIVAASAIGVGRTPSIFCVRRSKKASFVHVPPTKLPPSSATSWRWRRQAARFSPWRASWMMVRECITAWRRLWRKQKLVSPLHK